MSHLGALRYLRQGSEFMTVEKEIILLKDKFKLQIPNEFVDFMMSDECKSIHNIPITIEDGEYTIGSFITVDEKMSGGDLYMRYVMCPDEVADYLAFACGFDNDEFSIKAKGDHLGKIYHIDNPDEEEIRIRKIFDTFKDFLKYIKGKK